MTSSHFRLPDRQRRGVARTKAHFFVRPVYIMTYTLLA